MNRTEKPTKCPICQCEREDYFTIFLKTGGWNVRFRCGHYFDSSMDLTPVNPKD